LTQGHVRQEQNLELYLCESFKNCRGKMAATSCETWCCSHRCSTRFCRIPWRWLWKCCLNYRNAVRLFRCPFQGNKASRTKIVEEGAKNCFLTRNKIGKLFRGASTVPFWKRPLWETVCRLDRDALLLGTKMQATRLVALSTGKFISLFDFDKYKLHREIIHMKFAITSSSSSSSSFTS